MMDLKATQSAARTLHNLLRAGRDIHFAVGRLSGLPAQKRYRNDWRPIYDQMKLGQPLSTFLSDLWPEELVEAVQVGENSGELCAVFKQISGSLVIRIKLSKQQKSLYYPFGIMIGAAAVSLGIIAFVVPNIAQMNPGEPDPLSKFALSLNAFLLDNGTTVLAGLAATVILLVFWLQRDENRTKVLDLLMKLPLFTYPLSLLYWGIWARYLSLMLNAGIPVLDALLPSSKATPKSISHVIELLHSDLMSKRFTDLINSALK